jgi:hypothetical protein
MAQKDVAAPCHARTVDTDSTDVPCVTHGGQP